MKKLIFILLASILLIATNTKVKAQVTSILAKSTTGAAKTSLAGSLDTAFYTIKVNGAQRVVTISLNDSVTSGTRVDTILVQVSSDGIHWATLATQPTANVYLNMYTANYTRMYDLTSNPGVNKWYYFRLLQWSVSCTIYPIANYFTRL
jgi:hypothetical protein